MLNLNKFFLSINALIVEYKERFKSRHRFSLFINVQTLKSVLEFSPVQNADSIDFRYIF